MRLLLLLYSLCAFACTRGEFGGVQAAGDTTTHRAAPGTIIGKMKGGTIIIQEGQGHAATNTDNTKAGQDQGSAATAPGAVASNEPAGPSLVWLVLGGLLIAGAGAFAWQYFDGRGWLKWLPWRTALVAAGLLLAQPSQAQAPADSASLQARAGRYDSLLTEYRDLERHAIKQQHDIDTLKIDLASAQVSSMQLRRSLFEEIDVTQSYELNRLIQAKERERQQRRQRKRNAVLQRQYNRHQRYLRRR